MLHARTGRGSKWIGGHNTCECSRDRALLRDFFRELDPMDSVVSGERRGWWGWARRPADPELPASSSPGVLLSRFRDNIYIVLMNVLQPLLPLVRRAVMCFLQCLYGVPLKWEPTVACVSWGECSWRVLPMGFFTHQEGGHAEPFLCRARR